MEATTPRSDSTRKYEDIGSSRARSSTQESQEWTPHSTNLAQLLLALREAPLSATQISKDMELAGVPQQDFGEHKHKQKKKRSQPKPEQPSGCNCRKSRCLKLYCQCFAQQIACNPTCRCMQCVNTGGNDTLVQAAVRAILERNPNAFESKFRPGKDDTGKVKLVHKLGCRCRRSLCLKKYCECFHGGVYCSDVCACTLCQNVPNPPREQSKLLLDLSDRDSSGGHSTASDSEDANFRKSNLSHTQQAQSPVKPRLDHETLRLQEGHHPAKVLQRSATVVTQGSDTAGEQDFTGNDSSLGYLLSNPQTATSLHQFDNKRSRDSAFTVASSSTDYPAKQIALIRPSEANPNMGYGHVPLSDRSASPSSLQCISALTMLCGAKVTPDINMSKAIEAESQKNDSKDCDFGSSPVSRIYKDDGNLSKLKEPVKYTSPSDSSVHSASGSDYCTTSPQYYEPEATCISNRHPRASTPVMHA